MHTEPLRYERAVLEIPVVERPVRVQTVGARPAAAHHADADPDGQLGELGGGQDRVAR